MKSRKTRLIGVIVALIAVVSIVVFAFSNSNHDNKHNKALTHNEVDVSFAQGMIPHHQQAIEMAKLASSRAESEDIKSLAEDIVNAQDPEIKRLREFLKSVDEPEGKSHTMKSDDSMVKSMGMASEDELKQMKNASLAKFDQLFLKNMIAHHEGAIEMANEELEKGTNPDMKKLASEVIAAQEKEIALMKKLQK